MKKLLSICLSLSLLAPMGMRASAQEMEVYNPNGVSDSIDYGEDDANNDANNYGNEFWNEIDGKKSFWDYFPSIVAGVAGLIGTGFGIFMCWATNNLRRQIGEQAGAMGNLNNIFLLMLHQAGVQLIDEVGDPIELADIGVEVLGHRLFINDVAFNPEIDG